MSEAMKGPWYVGTQNDALYIINKPPRPSTDDVNPDADVIVIAKVYSGVGGHETETANGDLLASAPTMLAENQRLLEANAELLAACQEAKETLVVRGVLGAAETLGTAIAKALAANATPRNIDQDCPACGGIGLHFENCGES